MLKPVNNACLYMISILLCLLLTAGCGSSLDRKGPNPEIAQATIVDPTTTASPPDITPTVKLIATRRVESEKKLPGEPGGTAQVIHDQTCMSAASEKRAAGGDEYASGRFERPFDREMNYLPALDISRAELFRPKDGWIYFKLHLMDEPASPPVVYGIELDLDIDGRGDLLIQVFAPETTDWTETGIKLWWDSDGDVGGRVINRSDPVGFKGSGFETIKVDSVSGKTSGQIYSRHNKNGVDIAIDEEVIGGLNGKFTWKVFTDGSPYSPTQYDLNDYFSLREAGSAMHGEQDYPLKKVFAVDNTCRGLSGLTPTGNEQGVCPP